MAVVSCGAAELLEPRARFFESAQIARERAGIFAGHLAEPRDIFAEAGEFRIDNGIGAEGGDDARLPCGIAERQVIGQ
jgi:hypothetical protein